MARTRMTKAPIIGINADIFTDASGEITGVRSSYWQSIERAGGIPLLFPPLAEKDALRRLLDRVDGMLMTGGDDLNSARWGEPLSPTVIPLDARREEADFFLMEQLLQRRTPTLAICLACQQLNVLGGGSLYQDLPTEGPAGVLRHSTPAGETGPTEHALRIEPGSALAQLWDGETDGWVNSVHHQGINRLGTLAQPIAWAPDGIVEALHVPQQPFFLAVQWHPERMAGDPRQERLFGALVQHAEAGS